jgi:hypothetical protein
MFLRDRAAIAGSMRCLCVEESSRGIPGWKQ